MKETPRRTFEAENIRKDELFAAWIKYFYELHSKPGFNRFDEIYEGFVTISDLSQNRMSFVLDDKRKIHQIPITLQISEKTCQSDAMCVVLGRKKSQWWPLDVISIGSVIPGGTTGIHLTINPLLLAPDSVPNEVMQ